MAWLANYRREGERTLLLLTGGFGLFWSGVGLVGAVAAMHPTTAGALVGDNQFFIGYPPFRIVTGLHSLVHLARYARLRRDDLDTSQRSGSGLVLVSCLILMAWIAITCLLEVTRRA